MAKNWQKKTDGQDREKKLEREKKDLSKGEMLQI